MSSPRREATSSDEDRDVTGSAPSSETDERAPIPAPTPSTGNINGIGNGMPGVTNGLGDSARAPMPSVADDLSTRQNVNGLVFPQKAAVLKC